MNKIKIALSQFGTSKVRSDVLALLIEIKDLPHGDWILRGELAWPNGATGNRSKSTPYKKEVGGFRAYRTFKLKTSLKALWVQVIPLASILDAEKAVPLIHQHLKVNRFSKVIVTEDRVIEDRTIPGVFNSWISEKKTTGKYGPGTAWYIVGNVERYLFVVSASGFGRDWSLDEAIAIAARQGDKIREVIERRATKS
jgi:hypothetical protein